MNNSKTATSSLAEIVQKIVPLFNSCTSIEQFQNLLENFESDIEHLEARVQSLQQEIEILIAEQ